MKHHHKLVLAVVRGLCALAVLPLCASCLDDMPKDRADEEVVYTSAADLYTNAVAVLYNYIGGAADSQGIQGTYRGVYDYNTFSTDEAIIPIRGGDWYDGGFWENLYLHRWTPADQSLYDTWGYLYKVVMLCNRALATIDGHRSLLTVAQYEAYTAEVRAVRAMFYAYLMDMYGTIPVVKSANVPLDSTVASPRSTTFRFVVDELQAVEPLLPAAHSNFEGEYYGRLTRPVVQFLLARLALNAEVYADDDWTDGSKPQGRDIRFEVDGRQMNAWEACIAYCNRLEAAGYRLESRYADNFVVHNEGSAENIFVIPMDKMLYANQFQYLFRSRHYNHGGALGTASENGACATLSTVRAYGYGTDSVDHRYALNFYSDTVRVDGRLIREDGGEPLVYRPLAVEVNLTYSPYIKSAGARMAKYEVDRTAHADGKLQDNDIVLFRFADVLLMRAEAELRNGGSGQADLDRVRARAGMPSRPATLDNVLAERLLELVWEGSRRTDLVRFGKYHLPYDMRPQLDREHTAYTTVFPIPSTALELNPRLYQNPGY